MTNDGLAKMAGAQERGIDITAKHTPTPFVLEIRHGYISRKDRKDLIVCKVYGHGKTFVEYNANRKANAEFIVRACNSHDVLALALSRIELIAGYAFIDPKLRPDGARAILKRCADIAEQALALAKGE